MLGHARVAEPVDRTEVGGGPGPKKPRHRTSDRLRRPARRVDLPDATPRSHGLGEDDVERFRNVVFPPVASRAAARPPQTSEQLVGMASENHDVVHWKEVGQMADNDVDIAGCYAPKHLAQSRSGRNEIA